MSAIHRIPLLLTLTLMVGTLQAQSGVEISSQDGLFSVKADNISASTLAAELSEQLGISVVVTGDTETQVNLEIVDEPLEIALAKISPNHMLVRSSSADEITEVVLMMGEGQDSAGSSNVDEFLPSGSPADEIIDDQSLQQLQGANDPNAIGTTEEVRDAAEAANNMPPPQMPPILDDDGLPLIDPATGLPYEQ